MLMKTNKNYWLPLLFMLLLALPATAQKKESPSTKSKSKKIKQNRKIEYREFSFNINSIFQHIPIIPTNDPGINAYDILFRRKRFHKKSTNRFGLSGTFLPNSGGINSIVLKWGREWHHPLLEEWSYYFGFDILVFGGPNTGGLGTGPIGGLRYQINDRIFLSTESSIYLVIGEDLGITVRPPSAIALNIQFVKN